MRRVPLILFPVFFLSACLQTRESQKEQEEKQVLKKQLSTLQMTSAETNARFQDIEDELRKANGRIEAVEARIQQSMMKSEKSDAAIDGRLSEKDKAYREEFTRLANDIKLLKEQLALVQEESRRVAAAQAEAVNRSSNGDRSSKDATKNAFKTAEEQFKAKNWREAILSYQNYRSANPKGKSYAAATLKIGLCFQELGMVDEAQSFYEEVVGKFPKSKEAEKANAQLKKIKSKKS